MRSGIDIDKKGGGDAKCDGEEWEDGRRKAGKKDNHGNTEERYDTSD